MSSSLEKFAHKLLASIELYYEIQSLREFGFSEEEVTGWIETYAEEIINLLNKD